MAAEACEIGVDVGGVRDQSLRPRIGRQKLQPLAILRQLGLHIHTVLRECARLKVRIHGVGSQRRRLWNELRVVVGDGNGLASVAFELAQF